MSVGGERVWVPVPWRHLSALSHRADGLLDCFSQGLERPPGTVSGGVLHGIEPRLKDFHQLLLSPPKVWV